MRTPDDSPCWSGDWTPTDARKDLWAQSAMLRTVRALPTLHPWRLADDKGALRTLMWCAASATTDVVAVLTQTAPPPSMPLGDEGYRPELFGSAVADAVSPFGDGLLTALAVGSSRVVADAMADALTPDPMPTPVGQYRKPAAGVRQWAGAIARLPRTWLPPVAILPRSARDFDDPGTQWSTESLAFAARHSVHAEDTRLAADLLAPHVMALIVDTVPSDAAITIAGDALHVWWPYDDTTRQSTGKVGRTAEVADQLRRSLPSFVLADHPDHSDQVENRLSSRAAEAAAYRAARDARLAEQRRTSGL